LELTPKLRLVKNKKYKKWRNKNMKKVSLLIMCIVLLVSLAGCAQRESDQVSYNLSLEADNFNIVRQLTVINAIQGDVLFQMTGKMSINADTADNQLEVTIEDENGKYQKHFIGLSDNVTYVVEQKNYENVNQYKYTLNYNPKMWIPVEVETVD
jgi:outer membrane lipoprotein-sorting protein